MNNAINLLPWRGKQRFCQLLYFFFTILLLLLAITLLWRWFAKQQHYLEQQLIQQQELKRSLSNQQQQLQQFLPKHSDLKQISTNNLDNHIISILLPLLQQMPIRRGRLEQAHLMQTPQETTFILIGYIQDHIDLENLTEWLLQQIELHPIYQGDLTIVSITPELNKLYFEIQLNIRENNHD